MRLYDFSIETTLKAVHCLCGCKGDLPHWKAVAQKPPRVLPTQEQFPGNCGLLLWELQWQFS